MHDSIKKIIAWTLHRLDMHSDDAVDMIFRTGMAESGYRALEQTKGPAIGFFQVEPDTVKDTLDNYLAYRPHIKAIIDQLGFVDSDSNMSVMSSISLQVAFCRLKYRRDRHPLPKGGDLEAQAKYWKRVYNSELGKGTVEHFMEANDGV